MDKKIYLGFSTKPASNEEILFALKWFDSYMHRCINIDDSPGEEEYTAGYIDGIYNCICQFNKMFNF